MRGQFVKHIERALEKDRGYLYGSPLIAYGRFFYQLPLPGNMQKAEKYLTEAVTLYPGNIRAHHYLGAVYLKLKKIELAKKEFEFVLSHPGISEMAPENKVDKEMARRYLNNLGSVLPRETSPPSR